MKFNLVRPCNQCPFAKESSIELREGRVPEIIEALKSDIACFPCHKTTDGEYDDDGKYQHSHNEQACMGALAYMRKHHDRLPVLARLAIARRWTSIKKIDAAGEFVNDPKDIS